MQIIKQIVSVVKKLAPIILGIQIIFILGVIVFVLRLKNPSANQAHSMFSNMLEARLEKQFTPEMAHAGQVLLGKFANPDYTPRVYESNQPDNVFVFWYIVCVAEAEGKTNGNIEEMRQQLAEFVAKD
jgi:hypothetical protein